ncbi:hypothetical protein TVAG_523200 [Trichomonas vaginalis G3]|uniref:Glycosyltransferase family 17 protein n=1 Tax=Trichomonas vaginalis (strain ATCC PRA-98 / G3) TaxID=412133 RepID=A2GH28_TRIV3|nr:beta-1,4-mannosyl-glycoprotein beta-1,4-n-acetylglucosaminyl-transferase family [Trichomonas vaginalis G3]EAX83539.1 hypothetical protein TVAG_523200 [Trichomonas vaginalis G3]KAI5495548.1 beta-1,4-mannosyl-glycoprotein beta-1,4-n-acetylglucosaminyl-transferase family [Trichomonas vaginalis G3]|eukprot:XP_001296469.1 hypothetical protein [Trichomonas vaginalis G3]
MLYTRIWRLQPYVDHFVVVSSSSTFTSKQNNITIYPFEKEIQALGDKIHFFQGNLPADIGNWERERIQRNSILNFTKSLNITAGDLMLVSDVDEIPTIFGMEFIIQNPPPDIYYNFHCDFYNHNYNSLKTNKWSFPAVFRYRNSISKELMSDTRNSYRLITNHVLGTHCSYCFKDIETYLKKFHSFSHQEYNKYPYTDPNYLFWTHYCKKPLPSGDFLNTPAAPQLDLVPKDSRLQFLYDPNYVLDIEKTNFKKNELPQLCKKRKKR